MTWLIGDGFDFYLGSALTDALSGAAPLWTGGSTTIGTVSATTRFGVGQSITNNLNTGTSLFKDTGSNDAEVIVNFATEVAPISGSSKYWCFTLGDGATAQCSVCIVSDGSLVLTSGDPSGSTLATYSSALTAGTWAHFQVRVVVNNTTGSIRVRKNGAGSDSFSASSLNTRGGTANNYANRISLVNQTASQGTCFVDDFYHFSASGSAPNDWQGDVRAVQQMVNSDPASPLFGKVPNTGTSFSKINQLIEDGNTTYIFDSNVGDEDDFGITSVSGSPQTIVAVQAKMFCEKSDSGSRSGDLHLKSGSGSASFGSTPLATTYGYLSLPLTTDPNTSTSWTVSGVNGITVGPKVSA